MAIAKDPVLPLKAKLFRGLSDPTRLSILECLRSGEKSVSQIVAMTRQSQPKMWFAVFPNVEGLLAQALSAFLVIGSYFKPRTNTCGKSGPR